MNFRDYIANAEKTFKFQIKTLFPLEAESLDLIEKALQKYRPSSISKPKKTMFQSNPLGFTGVKCAEVFIMDIELTVPVTPLVLQYDLRDSLKMHKDAKELKVFGEHSEELGDQMEPLGSDEEDKEKTPALLTNETYEEVVDAKFDDNYGDAYNVKFLAYIKKVEAERKAERGRGEKVDAKSSLAQWANQPEATLKDGDTEQPK